MSRSIANISERDVYDWIYVSPVTGQTFAITIPSNTCREFEDDEVANELLKQFGGILKENVPQEESMMSEKSLKDVVVDNDPSLPDHLVVVQSKKKVGRPKKEVHEESTDTPVVQFQEKGFENGKNIEDPVRLELGAVGEAPRYTCEIQFCGEQFSTNEERKQHIGQNHKEKIYGTRKKDESGKNEKDDEGKNADG